MCLLFKLAHSDAGGLERLQERKAFYSMLTNESNCTLRKKIFLLAEDILERRVDPFHKKEFSIALEYIHKVYFVLFSDLGIFVFLQRCPGFWLTEINRVCLRTQAGSCLLDHTTSKASGLGLQPNM